MYKSNEIISLGIILYQENIHTLTYNSHSKAMADNTRFFKALRFAHWHVELPIAEQLPMVISFWWEQTCELVKNNVIKKIKR